MSRLLIRWLATSLAIFLIPQLIHGVTVDGIAAALAAAAILGVLNTVVRPILVLLTFPLTLVSLGLFLLVINALMFLLVGAFVKGFHVDSFLSAFLASLIVTAVSWLSDLSGRGRIYVNRRPAAPAAEKSRGTIELNPKDGDRWE